MSDDPEGSGSQVSPRDSEEMRNDLRRVVNNYGSVTVAETLGVLELLKVELCDRLKNSGPECDALPDRPKPDI